MLEMKVTGLKKYMEATLVVKNITIEAYEGDRIGIVGANGSGKSTILKVIAGVEPMHYYPGYPQTSSPGYEEGLIHLFIFSVQWYGYIIKRYAKPLKEKSYEYRWRKELLRSAKGNILELSVGAGTNFQFYPSDAKITAVDFSPFMIAEAKAKASEESLDVEFVTANVEEAELEAGRYDTVISTLSLCSYPNPEKVLDLMAYWSRPDGQILLLEHGISTNPVYAWVQNKANSFLFKRLGCHQNRDSVKLLGASSLRISKIESFWLNSVHLIWASPGKK